MVYYLDGQGVLTAFASPYSFVLPTTYWSDGTHLFEVEPQMRDGFIGQRAGINVTFHNGVSTPPVNTATYTPTNGKPPPPGSPLVVAAVGDGAGGESAELDVTNLIASWNPNLALYLGDVYEDGLFAEFYNWYGATGQFFGRFRTITNPTIGNHEYSSSQAPGYFDYWNNVPNYYSFNAGGWHFISLNSNTSFVPAAPGSPQYSWLAQDLNATTAACTIVYYHHPLYNVGPEGPTTEMAPVWALLVQHGVTLVLNGHDHDYQRWVPLDGSGQPDPKGATQFVVGTGGHSSQTFITTDPRLAVGIDSTTNRYGALQLQLGTSSATFQYLSSLGSVLDSGVIPCVNPANGSPTATPSRTPTPTRTPSITPTPHATSIMTATVTPTATPTVSSGARHFVFLPMVVRPDSPAPGGSQRQAPTGTEGLAPLIEVQR